MSLGAYILPLGFVWRTEGTNSVILISVTYIIEKKQIEGGTQKLERKTKATTIVLLVIYLFLLIWIILFKMALFSEIADLDYIREINLIPFYYDKETSHHLTEVLQNVAIFVPVGIYLQMLKIDKSKSIIFGGGLSLLLETLQFIIGIGASDITDVITNTTGTIMGIVVYGMLLFIFKKREALEKVLRCLAIVCTSGLIVLISFILLVNNI